MHYSLMGKIKLPFIDSDLLYRGAAMAGLTVFIYFFNFTYKMYTDKL